MRAGRLRWVGEEVEERGESFAWPDYVFERRRAGSHVLVFPVACKRKFGRSQCLTRFLSDLELPGAGCCAMSPALPVLVTVEAVRAVARHAHFCCGLRDLALYFCIGDLAMLPQI
jgi:hypothetical protein